MICQGFSQQGLGDDVSVLCTRVVWQSTAGNCRKISCNPSHKSEGRLFSYSSRIIFYTIPYAEVDVLSDMLSTLP